MPKPAALGSVGGLPSVEVRGISHSDVSRFMPPGKNWKKFKALNPESSIFLAVFHAYVAYYFPLVRNVAGRMALGFPKSVELGDLVSIGVLGLIESIKNFDPNRGVKFDTFAIPRIRGAILDDLRALDWVPRSVRRFAREEERARKKIQNQTGREPRLEEIARAMKVPIREMPRILEDISRATIISLDELVYREEDNRQVARVETVENPNNRDPLFPMTHNETLEAIKLVIKEFLNTQEFLVIWMYYIENMTLLEIAEELEISESRVSQIHTRALSLLKGIFSNNDQWNFE